MENEQYREEIGFVVGGGLRENLKVRLEVPADEVQEGAFVVIESRNWLFYGLITDFQLGATDPRFADEHGGTRVPSKLAPLLHQNTLFTDIEVMPALMLERGPQPGTEAYFKWQEAIEKGVHSRPRALPVKTVPAHQAKVCIANEGDIAEIFGKVGDKSNFVIGTTREQGHPVVINLDKLVQRSSGVFGATGTGKSFLTRVVLSGIIKHDTASLLIFDMHNEYGFGDVASDTGESVPGLRTIFGPSKVQIVSLGSNGQVRGMNPDFNLQIALSDIQPEDIELLSRELNLKETTSATLDALIKSFGKDWFKKFMELEPNAKIDDVEGYKIPNPKSVAFWAENHGVNVMAAESLQSKLQRLYGLPYISEKPPSDSIGAIIQSLEAGKHVVLSFGKHEKDLDYLLVTNLLSRKIREAWEKSTDTYRSEKKKEPRPLVIVLEEAHKLLNREMASQTTFSIIAREMRKYYVTLLIIDQRPSQIFDEVMSQLGTRISGWLGDDNDIQAVLSGLAGRDVLRGMLSHLQPKEEVLLLGWGVPMPMPIRSRRYDETFFKEIKGRVALQTPDQIMKDLGF